MVELVKRKASCIKVETLSDSYEVKPQEELKQCLDKWYDKTDIDTEFRIHRYGGSLIDGINKYSFDFQNRTCPDLINLVETWPTKEVSGKFAQNPDLLQKLLDTGDAHLEETNTWKDTFWGVCKGEGQNNLGKILMSVREELREELEIIF